MLVTFTIEPPPLSFMMGAAVCVAASMLTRLMSMWRRQLRSLCSRNSRALTPPALFTRMFKCPKCSAACSTACVTWSVPITSAGNTSASRPSSVIDAAVRSARSGSMSSTATSAPNFARPSAMPCPIPPPAPVTIAA